MKNFTLLFSALLLTAFGWQANAQCDHTFTVMDSYGDGWNGATVDLTVNGATVLLGATAADAGLTTGSTEDILFPASTGDAIALTNWVSGSFDGEVSWEIKDGDAVVIASGVYGGVPAVSGACSSCPVPSAGTATNITSSSADLGWTAGGTETMWDLEYGVSPYTPTGTPTVSGITNPYNYSGLTASTTYEFYVRADCGGTNGTSAWVGPYSFTTYGDCASSGTYDYVANSTMASSLQSFVANTPGDYITLTFSAGSTETGWDYWFINDAADGSGATIATGDGAITGAYESTTGEISFYVESDGGVQGTTFVYDLSCSPPPSCPESFCRNSN